MIPKDCKREAVLRRADQARHGKLAVEMRDRASFRHRDETQRPRPTTPPSRPIADPEIAVPNDERPTMYDVR
jgi:hypothetical protein